MLSIRCPLVRVGDVCEINLGTRITKKNNTGTLYSVYGGSEESFRTDNYNRDGINCKIRRFRMSPHNCVQIIYGKFWALGSGFTITSKSDIINEYLWYWFLKNQDLVYQCGHRIAPMNIQCEIFESLKIPYPQMTNEDKQRFADLQNEIDNKKRRVRVYKSMIEKYFQQYMSMPITASEHESITAQFASVSSP